MSTKQTKQIFTTENVYNSVKVAILNGDNLYSTKFFESTIANHYNVSRTPIREVLNKLLNEGLIQKKARIYTVRKFSAAEVQDLFSLRASLEVLSIKLASLLISKTDIEHLKTIISEMESYIDDPDKIDTYREADKKFHTQIARASENHFLMDALASIQDKVTLIRREQITNVLIMKRSHLEHRNILHAIERGLPDVAIAEMSNHLKASILFLKKLSN